MSLSLPLRINLISLVFASLVATVLTALGGSFLYHQQVDNAVARAQLAADELASRAHRLLELELRLQDIIGFDEQCLAVIRNDPVLRSAAVFDIHRARRFASTQAKIEWPQAAMAPEADRFSVAEGAQGPVVIRPLQAGKGEIQGYAMVTVDADSVVRSTLGRVAWLVSGALGLFVVGLILQQGVFWRTVGRPLADLVETADQIQPDNLRAIQRLEAGSRNAEDDIGRLYGAFARLMQRLLDARAQLVRHNEALEATVHERTRQLELANAELARDIERRKELEDELRRLATTDALTGLANRGFILPHAQKRIVEAGRQGRLLALLVFDLDGFKAINDTHGHAAGDEVLRVVARRLARLCEGKGTASRLGGDEFLVVLDEVASEDALREFGERLMTALSQPLAVGKQRLSVGASVGAAIYPSTAGGFDALMAAADEAMYAIKQRGGGFNLAASPSLPPASAPRAHRAPEPVAP